MKSILKQIRLSPKKAQLVASMVRWLDVTKALSVLKFLDKKWADIMKKILASAVANAENNFSQKKADLYITKVLITPWSTYKRWRSRSKWRVFSILKRTSHITIELWVKNIESQKLQTVDKNDNSNKENESKSTAKKITSVKSKVESAETKPKKSTKTKTSEVKSEGAETNSKKPKK